jgi:hypothetical protein
MITMTWTDAPAGTPVAGLVARPRVEAGAPAGYRAVIGCSEASRRAPEAFTTPFQGTGLPIGGTVPGAVAPAGLQRNDLDITRTDATTLGIHSSRRPPS